jgi:hypothetical protein
MNPQLHAELITARSADFGRSAERHNRVAQVRTPRRSGRVRRAALLLGLIRA